MTGKPQFKHKKTFTSTDYTYKKAAVECLEEHRSSLALSRRISDCGRIDRAYGGFIRYCNQPFCPDCRWDFIRKRQSIALSRLAPHPKDYIFSVTVIFRVQLSLFDHKSSDLPCLDLPEPSSIKERLDGFKLDLRAHKKRLRRTLDTARLEGFVANGGIEFESVPWPTGATNKDRFVRAYWERHGSPDLDGEPDLLVPHCHFLVCAKGPGGYLDRQQIGSALRRNYDLITQVKVNRLYPHQIKQTAIANCTGYALKGHIGKMPSRHVRQVAVAQSHLKRPSFAFDWTYGTMSRKR